MNINCNLFNERDNDFVFFSNNQTVGLETINQYDQAYFDSIAFENLFTNPQTQVQQRNTSLKPVCQLEKPFKIEVVNTPKGKKPKKHFNLKPMPKPMALEMKNNNYKQTLSLNENRDITPNKNNTPLPKDKSKSIKILTSKKWRERNKAFARSLEESVYKLRNKRDTLRGMDNDTLILQQYLIKTMPNKEELKDIKGAIYNEVTDSESIINNIHKYKKANLNAKQSDTNNNSPRTQSKQDHIRDLYLENVTKLIQGYEAFKKERAKLNEVNSIDQPK